MLEQKKMKPLFIWAGGKSRLINNQYKQYLPEKKPEIFIEPFFGGGAMFCWLYNHFGITKSIINDANEDIMSIYDSIQKNVSEFCNIIDEYERKYIPLNKDERKIFFYSLRNENAWEYKKWNKIHQSAVQYVLMRLCFNGIYQINQNTNNRFGTPSGLLNQKDKIYDRNNVLLWNMSLSETEILSKDFRHLHIPKGQGFVFCDPPYRGSFTSYGRDFSDKDQKEVISFGKECQERGHLCLISNRDLEDGFYDGNKSISFPITYTAGRRKKTEKGFEAKKAKEILILLD